MNPGLFRAASLQTVRARFRAYGFPATYAACATGLAWIQSWHGAQTMSVLRLIFAMRVAHAGWPGPGFPRSVRPVTWWTATVVPVSQRSHSRLRSRLVTSWGGWRGGRAAGGGMPARRFCRRMIPPNRATRSFLPSRCFLASKQVRRPSLVSILALYLAAVLEAVLWCLAARVFSIDVMAFQCRVFSR